MDKVILVAAVAVMMVVAFACTGVTEANTENLVKTGIIGAMDEEVATLKEALTEEKVQTIAGLQGISKSEPLKYRPGWSRRIDKANSIYHSPAWNMLSNSH